MEFTNPYITKQTRHLERIYRAVRKVELSKTTAMEIVGSRTEFERLVATHKIRVKEIANKAGVKWFCNAEDVLRYANYKEISD